MVNGHLMGTDECTYKETHPWLTFRVDLRVAGPELWMLLGEARSKVDHLSRALLRPDVAREMHQVFLAKGAQATTAIEGNTLTEAEVADIIAGRSASPPPSQRYLHQEVENVVRAFNRIKDDLLAGSNTDLTPEAIMRFDREVLDGLSAPGETPGSIRHRSVVVGRYRGAPAQECCHLLERLCGWLNGPDFRPPGDEWTVPYALIKAVIAHLYIAWIHPFDDGNGRTARLIELQILLAAGVPMPAAHLLSNHYNATRSEYYRQLDAASRSGGDTIPFLNYAIEGFVDGARSQLERVWDQQYADRWEQFIYETFGGRVTSPADRRRLHLTKMLSRSHAPLTRREIVGLSPELAAAYTGTERMLSRDLNALETMGLIETVGRGKWRVRREQILAFRPLRHDNAGAPLPER
jgi:Fic family protein